MLPEYFRKSVNHKFVLRHELRISLAGFVPNWFNYLDVKLRVIGYELPEALAAKFQIIALIFADRRLFSITASVNESHRQVVWILSYLPPEPNTIHCSIARHFH